MIKERNIVLCIFLSIITCGIYGIYWFCTLTDDTARANDDPDFSGIKSLIFTIITCGIYGLYWNYKVAKEVYEAGQKKGLAISDNSAICLICSIFGLAIITYILVQSDLNNIAQQQQQ